MDIVTGIAAARQALDIAKAIRSVEKSFDEATLKAQLAELVSALADAKLSMVDAKDELANKEQEIVKLKENFARRDELVVGDGDYKFFADKDGHPLGFPICPSCELAGLIVQVKQHIRPNEGQCPKCKSVFTPVTCYLDSNVHGDNTLVAKRSRESNESYQRSLAGLNRLNRGY